MKSVTNKRTIKTQAPEGLTLEGHLVDNSVWRSYLRDRTIVEVFTVNNYDEGIVILLDDNTFFSVVFSDGEVIQGDDVR